MLPKPSTLDEPIAHLAACHRRIEERLDTLERVGLHWLDRREEALTALQNTLRFFDTNGVWHTADEEESFFPRLQQYLTAADQERLANLEKQHDEAEEVYAQLKACVDRLAAMQGDIPEAALDEYRVLASRLAALYRAHIAEEDREFPLLGQKLSESELAAIAAEMKTRRGIK